MSERTPRKLTDKQRAFAHEYLKNGRNAAEAYRKVYKSKASATVVAVNACKLLKNANIALIVAEAEKRAEAATQRALDRYEVTAERIVAGLARLGFYDARDIFTWSEHGVRLKPSHEISDDAAAAITEISETITKDGGTIKVKLADKRAALVDLGRHKGIFVDKVENGKPGDFSDMTDDELRDSIVEKLTRAGVAGGRTGTPRTRH